MWCPHAPFWALVDRLKNTRNTEFGKACFKLKVPREVPPRASRDSRSSESTRVPNLNRVIAADARAGTTVGKYKLHEIVGRGGMGVVYRAEHVYIGKEVAVKILHDGYGGREESIKRFLREARAASLINHPNIVDITDFGKSSDGTVFFVMEFLRGQPLDAVLQHERRLELLRAITIINQIAGALGAAHAKGIVHRDLKPENIMLTPREGRRELIRQISDETGTHTVTEREKAFDFVKILDFGVAKVRDPNVAEGRVTQQGVVFGTPEYMAPETARVGISDPRTDIYAVGVIFYEMLTGVDPVRGRDGGGRDAEGRLRAGHPAARAGAGHRDHPRGRSADHEGAGQGPAQAPPIDGGAARRAPAVLRLGPLPPLARAAKRGGPAAPAARRPSGPAQVVATPPAHAAGPVRRHEPGPLGGADPADQEERAAQDAADGSARQRRHAGRSPPPAAPPAAARPRRRRPARRHPPLRAVGHDEWSEPALRTPPATTAMDEWTEFDLDSPE